MDGGEKKKDEITPKVMAGVVHEWEHINTKREVADRLGPDAARHLFADDPSHPTETIRPMVQRDPSAPIDIQARMAAECARGKWMT